MNMPEAPECWQIGDLEIDIHCQRVTQAGVPIELPVLSYKLLLELVHAAPAPLSIEQLMDQVWEGMVVNAETVTQRVKLLRDALGDDYRSPRYVEGLRGRGYRLAQIPLRVVPAPEPSAVAAPVRDNHFIDTDTPLNTATTGPQRVAISFSGKLGWLAGIAILATIVAITLVWSQGSEYRAKPARNPVPEEASALYQRAHYLTMRRTADGLEQALVLYRQALSIAPEYAAPWEGIARVYQFQGAAGFRPAPEAYDLARSAATNALAIDPDFGLAHTRLGALAMIAGNLNIAARHLQHGINLDPHNQLTLGNGAVLLRALGRFDEAVELGAMADQLDPLNPASMTESGYTRLLAGKYEQGIERLRAALLLKPDFGRAHFYLGMALLATGRPSEALHEMEQEADPIQRLKGLALVNHNLGRIAEAHQHLQDLTDLQRQGKVNAYTVASVQAYLGNADNAFIWLAQAIPDRRNMHDIQMIAVDPLFKGLHGDKRWQVMMTKLGKADHQLAAVHFDPLRDLHRQEGRPPAITAE
jgi:DNA-binding winged helix-turn-helix (wHTH) protein/tetratricopeptide (TPR) repeat protein